MMVKNQSIVQHNCELLNAFHGRLGLDCVGRLCKASPGLTWCTLLAVQGLTQQNVLAVLGLTLDH